MNKVAKIDCSGRNVEVASMVRTVRRFIAKARELGTDIVLEHFLLHSRHLSKIFMPFSRNVGRFYNIELTSDIAAA